MSMFIETLHISFIDRVKDIFTRASTKNQEYFYVNIPENILCRTQLICDFIQEEHDCVFGLNNFLMLLYLDFLKTSVKSYNPEKLFKLLSKDFFQADIIISNGTEDYSINRTNYNFSNLTISMNRWDFEKGQLILDEIYDLYKYKFSFSHLIQALWLDFIENYKNGTNKSAYYSIISLLKQCLKE